MDKAGKDKKKKKKVLDSPPKDKMIRAPEIKKALVAVSILLLSLAWHTVLGGGKEQAVSSLSGGWIAGTAIYTTIVGAGYCSPTDPLLCCVEGYIYTGEGVADSGLTIYWELMADDFVFYGNNLVTRRQFNDTTSATGYWNVSVYRNPNLTDDDSYWKVRIPEINFEATVTVPDTSTIQFQELF